MSNELGRGEVGRFNLRRRFRKHLNRFQLRRNLRKLRLPS